MELPRQVVRYNEAARSWVARNLADDRAETHFADQGGQQRPVRPGLREHLEFLKELEYEKERILRGQPAYERKIGPSFILPRFKIPEKVWEAIVHHRLNKQFDLFRPLMPDNYVHRFQTLLWIEEADQDIEMRRHDLREIKLAKSRNFFAIKMPGLAKGSPPLVRDDKLILRDLKRSLLYEGYIHHVRENDILVKLHIDLHDLLTQEDEFDVLFVNQRTSFRRCHQAVHQFKQSKALRSRAFPVVQQFLKQPLMNVANDGEQGAEGINFFKKCLNTYQRTAVCNALRAECRPAPYIIFGPPGTGKTLTMVEVILQAYTRNKGAKILICANSNACTDKLAQNIKSSGVVPREDIIRLAAYRRIEEKLIPGDIQDITLGIGDIDSEAYSGARIIVTTCIQSGCLNEFRDRFDYLFIDEAGHATEPEAMIAMSLLKEKGVCVLAGDPHQLGPVCISMVAFKRGLGTSLLERLANRIVYSRRVIIKGNEIYDPRYISQLIVCHRCDPRVLSIGNEMFYNNALQYVIKTPAKWLKLLRADQPLVFQSVRGKENRTHDNPSWYNPLEAAACLEYAKRLYKAGLKPEQLGIITPYKRQIEQLHTLFENSAVKKCKIATMEQFQGDEREIIIISTVRTGRNKLDYDKKRLQFLFNPKRFNVALSRAKWMVIAVGDFDTLAIDKYWLKYMNRGSKIGTS